MHTFNIGDVVKRDDADEAVERVPAYAAMRGVVVSTYPLLVQWNCGTWCNKCRNAGTCNLGTDAQHRHPDTTVLEA